MIFLSGRDIFCVLFEIQQAALGDDTKTSRAILLREVILIVLFQSVTKILSAFFSQGRKFGATVMPWNDALNPRCPMVGERSGR